MHLNQLELRHGSHALGETGIAGDVAQGLSVNTGQSVLGYLCVLRRRPDPILEFGIDSGCKEIVIPLRLVLGEHLSFCMIPNDTRIDEAGDIQLLRAERCRHLE